MNGKFKTKRDKILFYFDKYAKNQVQDEALESTKDALSDIENGYITEIIRKNRYEGLEPKTPLQKAVVEVFNEHPDWTQKKIAEEAGERIGVEPPSQTCVSDYMQLFCDEKRRNPDSYTISEKFKDGVKNRSNSARNGHTVKQKMGESETESEYEPEPESTSESKEDIEDGIQSLSNDDIFTIVTSLIDNGEDELARKIMPFYK